jgi:hypothetical protein
MEVMVALEYIPESSVVPEVLLARVPSLKAGKCKHLSPLFTVIELLMLIVLVIATIAPWQTPNTSTMPYVVWYVPDGTVRK